MVQKLNVAYLIPHMLKMLYKKSPKIHQGETFKKLIVSCTLFSVRIYTGPITLCLHNYIARS